MGNLHDEAEAIADRYLAQIPPTYSGRFSEIAKPDTVETLLRGFTAGLKDGDCCEAAGISPDTLQRWQQQAKAHPDSAYAAFAVALKKARAAGKLAHLENIRQHSAKDWKASAWTLERTDQAQFAIQHQQQNTGLTVIVGGDSKMLFVQQAGETLSPSVEVQPLSPPVAVDMHRLSVER